VLGDWAAEHSLSAGRSASPTTTSVEHCAQQSYYTCSFSNTHVHMPQVRVMASYGRSCCKGWKPISLPTESSSPDPDLVAANRRYSSICCWRTALTQALVLHVRA